MFMASVGLCVSLAGALQGKQPVHESIICVWPPLQAVQAVQAVHSLSIAHDVQLALSCLTVVQHYCSTGQLLAVVSAVVSGKSVVLLTMLWCCCVMHRWQASSL
jgi:hypothetical protein